MKKYKERTLVAFGKEHIFYHVESNQFIVIQPLNYKHRKAVLNLFKWMYYYVGTV